MLEGACSDESAKDLVSKLFEHLEENPPSERIKAACAENLTRGGGKLLDRSKYTPNPPLTDEMKDLARSFCKGCTDNAWEAEFYPFGDVFIVRWATN